MASWMTGTAVSDVENDVQPESCSFLGAGMRGTRCPHPPGTSWLQAPPRSPAGPGALLAWPRQMAVSLRSASPKT